MSGDIVDNMAQIHAWGCQLCALLAAPEGDLNAVMGLAQQIRCTSTAENQIPAPALEAWEAFGGE